MDIRNILLWVFFLVQLNATAQSISIKWTTFDKPLNIAGDGFVGHDETGVYLENFDRSKNSFYSLTKLDTQNNVILHKQMEPIAGLSKRSFEPHFVALDGHLWMYLTTFDKGPQTSSLLVQELDRTTLAYKGGPKVLETGYYKPTPDQSQIINPEGCPYFILAGSCGGACFKVYNSNFELIRDKVNLPVSYKANYREFLSRYNRVTTDYAWEKNFKFKMGATNGFGANIEVEGGIITGLTCDSTGALYINMFFFEGGRYGNYLFIIPKNSTTPIEVKLDNDSYSSLTSIQLYRGEVICAGFYSTRGRVLPEGIRYFRIFAASGYILTDKRVPLSDDVLNGLGRTTDEPVSGLNGIPHHTYHIHELLRGEGEDVFLSFGHELYLSNGPQSSATSYEADDYREIVAVHVSDTGAIIWQQKIPRVLGIVPESTEGSFIPLTGNGKFYALYDDAAKNINISNAEDMRRARPFVLGNVKSKRALVLATISAEGNLERRNYEEFTDDLSAQPVLSYYNWKGNVLLPVFNNPVSGAGADVFVKMGLVTIK